MKSWQVAVVTGASKGIGAALAKQLAADGAAVVVNYANSREGAEKVVADINASGGNAVAVGGSVTKESDITNLFAETKKAHGKVDILVNNAGIYSFATLDQVNAEEYNRQYDTNVLGLQRVKPSTFPAALRFKPDCSVRRLEGGSPGPAAASGSCLLLWVGGKVVSINPTQCD
jgi:3-oxoacyl-[acyl-carrier protein] reductase